MKIGDLVKWRGSPFHSWNGIIIGWYFDQPEVLVLQSKYRMHKNVTLPFERSMMEVVSEGR